MDFFNYLSASVGSIISVPHQRGVYMEMIIPDSDVNLQPGGVKGEKEVLLKKIKTSNISKVFVGGSDEVYSEILENAGSNLYQFISQNHPELKNRLLDAVNRWRWDERTENYLPVSLLKNLNSKKFQK